MATDTNMKDFLAIIDKKITSLESLNEINAKVDLKHERHILSGYFERFMYMISGCESGHVTSVDFIKHFMEENSVDFVLTKEGEHSGIYIIHLLQIYGVLYDTVYEELNLTKLRYTFSMNDTFIFPSILSSSMNEFGIIKDHVIIPEMRHWILHGTNPNCDVIYGDIYNVAEYLIEAKLFSSVTCPKINRFVKDIKSSSLIGIVETYQAVGMLEKFLLTKCLVGDFLYGYESLSTVEQAVTYFETVSLESSNKYSNLSNLIDDYISRLKESNRNFDDEDLISIKRIIMENDDCKISSFTKKVN